VRGAVIM